MNEVLGDKLGQRSDLPATLASLGEKGTFPGSPRAEAPLPCLFPCAPY